MVLSFSLYPYYSPEKKKVSLFFLAWSGKKKCWRKKSAVSYGLYRFDLIYYERIMEFHQTFVSVEKRETDESTNVHSSTLKSVRAEADSVRVCLIQAGLFSFLVLDNDKNRCETLWRNHPETPVHCISMKTWGYSEYVCTVDLLTSGDVSCQSFSQVGTHKGLESLEDSR